MSAIEKQIQELKSIANKTLLQQTMLDDLLKIQLELPKIKPQIDKDKTQIQKELHR